MSYSPRGRSSATILRRVRGLGLQGLALSIAFGTIIVLFLTNKDMAGDPNGPRGDGRYRPVLARGDGHMLYLMARSTALDGDWNYDNDLARFGDPWDEPRTATGRKGIIHPIGPALVWTPLIWIAEGAAVIANFFGARIPLHGYTEWHQRFVFLSSALFACGAVLLGWLLLRRLLRARWAATYAAVAVLLGTSLTYYATYMPSYTHAMDAFACAGFLYYWSITVGTWHLRRWFLLGVLLGVATLIRIQDVAFGIVIVVEVVARVLSRDARTSGEWSRGALKWLGGGCITLAVTFVLLTPQLLEWHVVFGKITALPQGAKYTRPNAPMVGELLWSARNGWFSTTPIAYAGVVGLLFLPKQARLIGVALVLAVALQVYLNSTILDWWGGASYGQRRLCSVTLPLVVGLATLLWRLGRLLPKVRFGRVIAHCVVSACLGGLVTWNLWRVRSLAGGKSAAMELVPTCCTAVPLRLRGAAQWVYGRVGNPFEFPASMVFAVQHHVPWSAWDRVVGDYPVIPSLGDVRSDKLEGLRGVWRVGSPNRQAWLLGGWSAPQQEDRLFRYLIGTAGTVLVPNLLPQSQVVTVWMRSSGAARVALEWNGMLVARTALGASWSSTSFEMPDHSLHTNELVIKKLDDASQRVDVSDIEIEVR